VQPGWGGVCCDLFADPLTVQQVRLCTAITWCIAVVIIAVVGLR
jgi:hypothetical protein